MPVSEDLLEFLGEGAVAIEVYGHKQANHRRNLALWDLGVIQAKTRSLRERSGPTKPPKQTQNLPSVAAAWCCDVPLG